MLHQGILSSTISHAGFGSDILVQQKAVAPTTTWPGFNPFSHRLAMTLLPKVEEQLQHHNKGERRAGTPPPALVAPRTTDQAKENCAEDLSMSKMDETPKAMKLPSPLKRSLSNEDCHLNNNQSEQGVDMKKKRVENIVTSICQPRSPRAGESNLSSSEQQRNKRKQFTPQQHGVEDIDVVTAELDKQDPPATEAVVDQEKVLLKDQLKIMGEQLQKMQQRYQEVFEKRELERLELMSRLALHPPQVDLDSYLRTIRTEIAQSVKLAITETLEKSLPLFKDKVTPSRDNSHREVSSSAPSAPTEVKRTNMSQAPLTVPSSLPQPSHPSLANPLLPLPMYFSQTLNTAPFHGPGLSSQFNNSLMPGNPLHPANAESDLLECSLYGREAAQGKRPKRTKVTDTRLSPRTNKPPEGLSQFMGKPDLMEHTKAFEAYANSASLFPSLNQSMAAMQTAAFLNGLYPHTDSLKSGTRSPTNVSDISDRATSSPDLSVSTMSAMSGQNVTLTPLHLRKAKLMFFYVRYPSSVLLKNYFCDVYFNKNNTAQLVKWFSNFREFYYIQMEKYARQSIAEGLSADRVEITTESELYKILNLHYNRNNQIEVPKSFVDTIQVTLREFIRAITLGKDREQSWKKPIYKVIARLDDTVPEYFKSQDWMEQLSD